MNPRDNIDVVAQLEAIAIDANKRHLSHDLLTHHLAMIRTKVGKDAGWTDEQIAVSKGITPRQEYHQRQEYENRKLGEKMHNLLADGRDPLDRILDLTRPEQPVTLMTIMREVKGFTMEQILVIIKRGVKEGILRPSKILIDSPDGTPQYEATGKLLVYPAAKSPAERAARSYRAISVARQCKEANVYCTIPKSLTKEGVEYVHRFLDPSNREVIAFERFQLHEGATNFGLLMVLTQASAEDKQKIDPLWRAIIHHDDPENCVLRGTGRFDKKALASFTKNDAPAIRKQLEAVTSQAAALGEGPQHDFVLSFAFTRLTGVKGE